MTSGWCVDVLRRARVSTPFSGATRNFAQDEVNSLVQGAEAAVPTSRETQRWVCACCSATSMATMSTWKGFCAHEHVEAVDVVVLGGDLGPRGTGFGQDADGMRDTFTYLPKRGDGKIDWTTDEALAYMREGYASQKKWFTRTLVPMLERCAVPSVPVRQQRLGRPSSRASSTRTATGRRPALRAMLAKRVG